MDRINKTMLELLMILMSLGVAFLGGWLCNGYRLKAEIAEMRSEAAKAKNQAEVKARQAEQNHAQRLAEIDKTYTEKLKNEKNRYQAVMADLQHGTVQLRERFTCPGVSAVDQSAGMGNGTSGRGLRNTDAGFLVSEAGRADRIVTQLQACQEIIRADRTITAKDTDGTRQQ